MYLLDDLEVQHNQALNSAQAFADAKTWVANNKERFVELPTATVWGSGSKVYIDFDGLSHNQVMQVVMALGRPWKREACGERITYIHEVSPHLSVRCYRGEPPPNCKVVYEEVDIPAQPARKERRAKIICQPVGQALPATISELPDSQS